jgi:carboxylesterase type B
MAFSRLAVASLAAASALAAPWKHPQGYSSTPVAHVRNGTVEGVHSDVHNQDYFLGIPFAQPPTGANRFRVPQSLDKKFEGGVYKATEYSAACYGYGSDQWPYKELSEDCLYLNIVRPSGYEGEKLPVA